MANQDIIRHRIWINLVNTKYQAIYLALLSVRYQKRERIINIFLAVLSSAGVASWFIWEQFATVWASLIALSHILLAIRPYLPYYKYTSSLNKASNDLTHIHFKFDRLFYNFDSGKIDSHLALKQIHKLSKEWLKITDISDDIDFNKNKKLEKETSDRTNSYIKHQYNLKE